MVAKKKGLGKGLDSLIPEAKKTSSSEDKTIISDSKRTKPEVDINKNDTLVKIEKVEPNRSQPRKQFDEDALLELAESIKNYGVISPIIVTKKDDYYEIVAGERRWRAAKMAGLKEVPVIVKEFSEKEIVEISLIENIQREDLNPIEEALAYKRLLEEFDLKQDEVAERVSKSRTAVTNSMRLLKLEDKVQQMLVEEMISAGHARALLAIPDADMQITLANRIFDEKMSVRETEKLIKSIMEPGNKRPVKKEDPVQTAVFESLEERLKNIMGTKVSINRKQNNKGKIEIEYYSKEELDRIYDLLQSIG